MAAAGDDPSAPRDRRERDRLELLGDLRGDITLALSMVVREISQTGARIETSFPLQLHSLHDIRLSLGKHSVIVKARVAHCRLSQIDPEMVSYSSGLEFVDSSERAREAIRLFIESVRAQREEGGRTST